MASGWVLAAALPAVLAGFVALAGCTCHEVLEVDACSPTRACPLDEADRLVEWDRLLASRWPQVETLLAEMEPGEHRHPAWEGDRDAFWQDMGIDPASDDKRVYIERQDQLYRVRILTC